MPSFPCNPGRANWPGGYWRPNGNYLVCGRELNPATWHGKKTWAARLFVGLSVDGIKTHTLDDVVRLVKKHYSVGKDDKDLRGASFVAQKGLWPSKNWLTEEDSVQVILINLHGATGAEFTKQAEELADILCNELRQEEIVVEIQRSGIVKETFGVSPQWFIEQEGEHDA